ncbi:MAG: T9SS type A sorting domain-containing protein [Candidatus Hatepunaea meridiana]|nr:T9SS type A sorting domain-containing protein [Candidatus Hatepunaea meridiana]
MRFEKNTVHNFFIIISLLIVSNIDAVMKMPENAALYLAPPEINYLLGEVSKTTDVWSPESSRNAAIINWQSYRYTGSKSIAMATGSPFQITDGVSNENRFKQDVLTFILNHTQELGWGNSDPALVSVKSVKGINVVYLQQQINGVPVYGSYSVLSITSEGKLAMLKSRGFGSDAVGAFSLSEEQVISLARKAVNVTDGDNQVRQIYLPLSNKGRIQIRACYEVILSPSEPSFQPALFIAGDSGDILAMENRVLYDRLEGSITGRYKPLYSNDRSVTAPFPDELLQVQRYDETFTNTGGEFELDVNQGLLPLRLNTELTGRYVNVDYEDGEDANITVNINNLEPLRISWYEINARDDERSLYYHVNFIHSFWKWLDPEFDYLDYPLLATCMYGDNYDNAFSSGRGLFFGGGNEMGNFALYADIVYHEYGHSVTRGIYPWEILPYEGESGALNEAWSDYFPCSITDEPYMGEGGLRGNGYIRHLDNDLVYPEDLRGEVHLDSRIISAALWHTRQVLGREITDPLFHFARYELGNDFITHFTDILLTDDNDDDITNGTPHYRVLYEQFGRHGIGPGIHPKLIFDRIDLFDDNNEGADGDNDKLWEPGETIRIEVDLYRDGTLYPPPAEDVQVRIWSDHNSITFEQDMIRFGDMRVGDRREGAEALLFHINEDAPLSFANLNIMIWENQDINRIETLRIPLGSPGLLLVKDGNEGKDRSEYYTTALDELGQVYYRFDNAEPIIPLRDRLDDFHTILWFSGDAKEGILNAGDRAVLADFLTDGGNLLMTGQSLGSSPGAEWFFNEYLGVRHEIDSLHQVWLEGVENDPVGNGLQLLILGSGGANNQFRPAAISAIEPAVEVYHWTRLDDQPAAGVRRQDTETGSRTIYFAFGVEAVGGHGYTATREEALENALNWLGIETSAPEVQVNYPVSFQFGKPFPNPFNSELKVPFQLAQPSTVSLSVYDLTGREIWKGTKTFGIGQSIWSISADEWGSGIYIVKGGFSQGFNVAKVILIK